MKAFRSTLVLLLIAALLGSYIWKNERGPVVEQGAVELLRLDPAAVKTIELRAANSRLMLRRSGNAWTIAKPQMTPVPADEAAINRLLQPLKLLQTDAVVPQGAAHLKEYGLDTPRAVLSVQGRDLEFGLKPSFDASRVYARVGTQVALVPASLLVATSQGFDVWRDTRVLRFDPQGIVSVGIKAPILNAEFSMHHGWNVASPAKIVGSRVDEAVLTSFLQQVAQTRAAKFLDDNPQSLRRWGLDHPLATLTLAAGESERVLLIGKKLSGGYAAKNSSSPTVFLLPDLIFGLVNRPLATWRAHDILSFELGDLQQVTLGSGRAGREFAKGADGKWHASKDGVPVADNAPLNDAVLDLLLATQGLRAQGFVDTRNNDVPVYRDAAYGLDAPVFSVSLYEPEASMSRSVDIGRKSGRFFALLIDQDPSNLSSNRYTLYSLAPDALEPFQNGLKALFPPKTKSKKDTS